MHIQEEKLNDRFLLLPEYYQDNTYYGYLDRSFKFHANQSPFVLYFQTIPFPERIILWTTPNVAFSPIQVGEVRHANGLRRINRIDVTRFGLSDTLRLNQREKLGTLVPEISKI